MIFSKSFGYGVRSILYLVSVKADSSRVQLWEIAKALNMPRFFLSKILNRLVKEGILDSVKGHNGGFSTNSRTLSTRLSEIAVLTNDDFQSGACVIRLGACNALNPCPLHEQVQPLKRQWDQLLKATTVQDLLIKDRADLLKSIISAVE